MLIVSPPSPADRTAELSAELIRQTRMMHALRGQMSSWTPASLEWGAFTLLANLVKRGPLRQGELAECAMLDPSTVSRHVGALVRTGLVERRPDPSDGRAVQLVPSPAGQEVFADVARRRDGVISAVLARWAADDVTAFVSLLRRFNDDFEEYRPVLLATSAPDAPDRQSTLPTQPTLQERR